jgi:hypothetical protein
MIRIVFACQRRRGRRTRVLGRGFILDHQLDLAVADAALRIVALDRPLPMTLMRRASRLPIDWMEQRTLYIVSGQGSGEVKLKVGSDRGWIAPNKERDKLSQRQIDYLDNRPKPVRVTRADQNRLEGVTIDPLQ